MVFDLCINMLCFTLEYFAPNIFIEGFSAGVMEGLLLLKKDIEQLSKDQNTESLVWHNKYERLPK